MYISLHEARECTWQNVKAIRVATRFLLRNIFPLEDLITDDIQASLRLSPSWKHFHYGMCSNHSMRFSQTHIFTSLEAGAFRMCWIRYSRRNVCRWLSPNVLCRIKIILLWRQYNKIFPEYFSLSAQSFVLVFSLSLVWLSASDVMCVRILHCTTDYIDSGRHYEFLPALGTLPESSYAQNWWNVKVVLKHKTLLDNVFDCIWVCFALLLFVRVRHGKVFSSLLGVAKTVKIFWNLMLASNDGR